ncbi:hypothetical protein PYCCODRAFT_1429267 [Trametes coccinea BRFM310]|uniref:Uncharacterized protein n=1 Tax=Trametes coccinea (strain BRFM310) TaxID=1353009 RepID=A0A1Y2I4T7_TRAC3|nr:hypothetical protein PYCCODRAFT_1429267 [Trametes coccinea BRFM310]
MRADGLLLEIVTGLMLQPTCMESLMVHFQYISLNMKHILQNLLEDEHEMQQTRQDASDQDEELATQAGGVGCKMLNCKLKANQNDVADESDNSGEISNMQNKATDLSVFPIMMNAPV